MIAVQRGRAWNSPPPAPRRKGNRLMVVRTRLGIALLAVTLGMMACSGAADEASPAGSDATTTVAVAQDTAPTTTTQPAEAQITESSFASGATVDHPADWTSYGAGASGSLELAIPQVANVSLRDAASSEYLYGGLFTDADSLEGAMSVMALSVGVTDPTLETFTSSSGRAVLYAVADVDGAESLLAVTESADAYASVFAPSLAGPLPPDATTAILEALASITP
jgi:hypothetical protein